MSVRNPYIRARNALVSACLIIFYAIKIGIMGSLEEIMYLFQDSSYNLTSLLGFITQCACAMLASRIAIAVFSARPKVGIGNIILWFIGAFWIIRGIANSLILSVLTTIDVAIIPYIALAIWIILTLVEPIIATLRLPRLIKHYQSSKEYRGQVTASHRHSRTSSGRNNDSAFDFFRSDDDSSSYDRDRYDDYDFLQKDSYSDYYSSYDDYSSSSFFDFGSKDEYSYESYKESENYYSSEDSYAIYESYYTG